MWFIHIKLKSFCWEEKLFIEYEKREYIYNWRDFFGKIKLVNTSYIKNNCCNYVYVNRQTSVWVFNYMSFWEKAFINQEHNLLPDCAFGPFTFVCCENCMSGFSTFVLNLSKSGNILFRSMLNGNCLFSSASLSLVGDNSLVHELRMIAAVELHLYATYYAQHPVLKSVY